MIQTTGGAAPAVCPLCFVSTGHAASRPTVTPMAAAWTATASATMAGVALAARPQPVKARRPAASTASALTVSPSITPLTDCTEGAEPEEQLVSSLSLSLLCFFYFFYSIFFFFLFFSIYLMLLFFLFLFKCIYLFS